MGNLAFSVNIIISLYRIPEINTYESIGEDAMLHLLTETSIFVSLPNGCLCQLTGEPLINTMPPVYDIGLSKKIGRKRINEDAPDVRSERPAKRPKLDLSAIPQNGPNPSRKSCVCNCTRTLLFLKSIFSTTPVDVSFVRFRLFYSRPNYIPNSNHILVGLPLKRMFTHPTSQRLLNLVTQMFSIKYTLVILENRPPVIIVPR